MTITATIASTPSATPIQPVMMPPVARPLPSSPVRAISLRAIEPVMRATIEPMSGRIVSPAMQEELTDVLGRLLHLPTLMRWAERHAPASREVARLAQPVSAPGPLPHPQRLRCTDPDDQCFIDLAVSRRTPWLITRDHALRRLARRARAFGVAVVTPEGWATADSRSALRPPDLLP